MKEIGGFLELELDKKKEYYPNALKLNSGRNALRYILKAYNAQKIYLPLFICKSVIETIKKEDILIEFYRINKNFELKDSVNLLDDEYLLYVNYFGTKDIFIKDLIHKYENLIIDNSQAFFSPPYTNPTFYSPRKFLGVPDGGYLIIDKILDIELQREISYDKSIHLLKRYDLGSQKSYNLYQEVENHFSEIDMKKMSFFTEALLRSINYQKIKLKRRENFLFLHNFLSSINEFDINLKDTIYPMKYPLLIQKSGLKEHLIKNKIYISTYWKEVLDQVDKKSTESYLVDNLIPIPMDQRYNTDDMYEIILKINEFLD